MSGQGSPTWRSKSNLSPRCALFLNRFPGLSETFIVGQAQALLEQGVDLDVFSDARATDGASRYARLAPDLADRTYCRPTMPVRPLRRRGRAVAILAKRAVRDPVLVQRWVSSVAEHSGRSSPSRLRSVFDLPPTGHRTAYDAVICHYGHVGARAVRLRKLGALHGPILTIFHGHDVSSYLDHGGLEQYAELFDVGDLFLPVSEHWRERLIELGCDDSRIRVLHVGVDTRSLSYRERNISQSSPLRVLSVSRLVEKKGTEYGLKAIAKLVDSGVDVEYTVIGGGPLSDRLAGLTGDLGLNHRVRFLGAQPPTVVAAELDKADVLIAPSVTAADGDKEGVPVVLMEAMAVGVPVIATRHSGIPELVRHEQTGLLVEERDADGLATQIDILRSRPRLAETLTRRARILVEDEYDVQNQARRLLAMVQSLST